MKFQHSGDLGDLIAACAVIRELGGGDLVLYPTNTRERMTPERAAIITPLLEQQPYVHSVTYSDHSHAHETGLLDLDHWRHNYKSGLNLTDMYYDWIGKPHPDRDQPWLWVEPNPVAEVVFVRSPRYHGSFPWRQAVRKYAGRSAFLGVPDEHAAFCREFGDVPYHATKSLLEAAQVIQGAKLVCVNQTGLFWVTEGLKRPVCLEAAHGSTGLRNCHWGRTAFLYYEDQMQPLPDVEDLDERVADVCAERDLDRSIVSFDRRLALAKLALSCAHLPGEAAEVGVYKGGTAAVIAAALPGKSVHLFDTFAGCPLDDAFDQGHKAGDFQTSLEDVRKFLAGYKVEFHAGVFPETTAGLEDKRYSFVHLDGDLYQTTKDALAYFRPRMVEGGLLVLDDWEWQNCPGVKQAVAEAGLLDRVQRSAHQQAVIRR